MDQLPDALEAATGPHPDDLDLPALHHRARSRRTGRRAVLLTGALALVAASGLAVAAAQGGGGSRSQLTASGGGTDAASSNADGVAVTPCVDTGSNPAAAATTTNPGGATTGTTAAADAGSGATATAVPGVGPAETTVPGDASMTEAQWQKIVEYERTLDARHPSASATVTASTSPATTADSGATSAPSDTGRDPTGPSAGTAADSDQPDNSLSGAPAQSVDPAGPAVSSEPTAPTHATTTTLPPCAAEPPGLSTSTTTAADTTMTTEGPSSTTTASPTASAPLPPRSSGLSTGAGTFTGGGPVADPDPQGCPSMHHHLDLTLVADDGSLWTMSQSYCGAIDGHNIWHGEGTFAIDTPSGTLSGSFTNQAVSGGDGSPYQVRVEAGTGTWSGATGTIDIDTHLVHDGWELHQSGTFRYAIDLPTR